VGRAGLEPATCGTGYVPLFFRLNYRPQGVWYTGRMLAENTFHTSQKYAGAPGDSPPAEFPQRAWVALDGMITDWLREQGPHGVHVVIHYLTNTVPFAEEPGSMIYQRSAYVRWEGD